jgi:hypothetical protein
LEVEGGEGGREGGRGGQHLQGRVFGLGVELVPDASPSALVPHGHSQHLPAPACHLAARKKERVVLVWENRGKEKREGGREEVVHSRERNFDSSSQSTGRDGGGGEIGRKG